MSIKEVSLIYTIAVPKTDDREQAHSVYALIIELGPFAGVRISTALVLSMEVTEHYTTTI